MEALPDWPPCQPERGRIAHDLALLSHGFVLAQVARYHAAHEVWEDLWLRQVGPARAWLQGLIQGAAAHHLAHKRRWGPARILLARALGTWAQAEALPGGPRRGGPPPEGGVPGALGWSPHELAQAWGLADGAWGEGHLGPPGRWAHQPPPLEAFAPHAGQGQPHLRGHRFAWDVHHLA